MWVVEEETEQQNKLFPGKSWSWDRGTVNSLIVRPLTEDTQPKSGHLRQNKRLQVQHWNGILSQ